jgi:AcrR family transcriptional regulator
MTNVRKYRQSRKAILQAAGKLLNECGWAGTTMTSIAGELNIPRSLINYYFDDKTDVLKSLTDDATLTAERLAAQISAQRHLSPPAALRRLVEQQAKLALSRSEEFRAFDRNECDMPKTFRKSALAARLRLRGHFRQVIQRGIDSGVFRDLSPSFAADAIIGLCNRAASLPRPKSPQQSAHVVAFVIDFAEHALRGDLPDVRRGP